MDDTDAEDKPSPGSFESSMEELEGIVERMEGGDMPLEQMIRNFQRGTQLIAQCRATLREAEQKIRVLEDGELKTFGNAPDSEA